MKTVLSTVVALALASSAVGQNLRSAVAVADVVVVATGVGVRPIGSDFIVHRLRVDAMLHGDAVDTIAVLEHKNLSEHLRPRAAVRRLYCLRDFSPQANRLGLPGRWAPYYKMSAYAGSNPPVIDVNADPSVVLTRALLTARTGAPAPARSAALLQLAFGSARRVRREAARALTESPALHASISAAQRSQLLARAASEVTDIGYKTALAHLCSELRMPGLVDSLCTSLGSIPPGNVESRRFAEVVGRIARVRHGESAAEVIRPHIARARDEHRGRLITALGATSTESALAELLRMRTSENTDPQVDAALLLHGSPRALRIVRESRAKNPR